MLSNYETAVFCEQLSMILSSGLSSKEGINIIQEELANSDLKKKCNEMIKYMGDGDSLSTAAYKSGLFESYLIKMIDIGEKTGYLDQVLKQLSVYYYRMDMMKKEIKNAMFYPGLLFCMMVIIMGILVVKVLPVFQEVLNNLGTDLSASAYILMNIGQMMAKYGFIIILVLLVLVGVFAIYYKNKYKDKASEVFLSHFFLTKKLSRNMEVAKFTYALGLLMNSGYDATESMKLLSSILDNDELKNNAEQCSTLIDEGKTFSEALIEVKIFSNVMNQLVSIGYKSGKLEDTLATISNEYEKDVITSINKFVNSIEPIFIGCCIVMVGIILASVMLPLMSIMSSLG